MKNKALLSAQKLDEIFKNTICIAVFIYNKRLYFILDDRENFELDLKITFDMYLQRNLISKEDYYGAYRKNRNGIWQLKKDNFEQYLETEGLIHLSKAELEELLFYGFEQAEIERLYNLVENNLAHNQCTPNFGESSEFEKINQIASRLPLFYINFDTKVYLHMDWDRSHEDYVYEGWFAKALDFGYMIPDSECYWKVNGRDFWKFSKV